jgi:hypothetical protein
VLYAALIAFEQRHVMHHIAELRRPAGAGVPDAAAAEAPMPESAIAA